MGNCDAKKKGGMSGLSIYVSALSVSLWPPTSGPCTASNGRAQWCRLAVWSVCLPLTTDVWSMYRQQRPGAVVPAGCLICVPPSDHWCLVHVSPPAAAGPSGTGWLSDLCASLWPLMSGPCITASTGRAQCYQLRRAASSPGSSAWPRCRSATSSPPSAASSVCAWASSEAAARTVRGRGTGDGGTGREKGDGGMDGTGCHWGGSRGQESRVYRPVEHGIVGWWTLSGSFPRSVWWVVCWEADEYWGKYRCFVFTILTEMPTCAYSSVFDPRRT